MTDKLILFDLDGTLIDSAADILNSLNQVILAENMEPFPQTDVHRLIGMGGRVMIERALTLRQQPVTEFTITRLLNNFNEAYSEAIPGKTKFFDGAVDALDQLTSQGIQVAICTNKTEQLARFLISALGEGDRFITICGGDSFPWKKPDPRHLFSTIARAGADKEKTVMVGDSAADFLAAKSADVPVVAVDFGYCDRPVADYQPSAIISRYSQLTVQLVDQLLTSKHIAKVNSKS